MQTGENTKWEMFQYMAAYLLLSCGYNGNAFETAESLDMSFEEVKDLHFREWLPKMIHDVKAYAADCPELFPEQH
jgi:hypothetical protein